MTATFSSIEMSFSTIVYFGEPGSRRAPSVSEIFLTNACKAARAQGAAGAPIARVRGNGLVAVVVAEQIEGMRDSQGKEAGVRTWAISDSSLIAFA